MTAPKPTKKTDPRLARTLGEACDNGNGTHDGYRLLSWLSEALNPGQGVSEEEVRRLHHEVARKRLG